MAQWRSAQAMHDTVCVRGGILLLEKLLAETSNSITSVVLDLPWWSSRGVCDRNNSHNSPTFVNPPATWEGWHQEPPSTRTTQSEKLSETCRELAGSSESKQIRIKPRMKGTWFVVPQVTTQWGWMHTQTCHMFSHSGCHFNENPAEQRSTQVFKIKYKFSNKM